MVSFRGKCLAKVTKSAKMGEIKGCGASFTRLRGRIGGYKEGV